jgi:hypothetical protein
MPGAYLEYAGSKLLDQDLPYMMIKEEDLFCSFAPKNPDTLQTSFAAWVAAQGPRDYWA